MEIETITYQCHECYEEFGFKIQIPNNYIKCVTCKICNKIICHDCQFEHINIFHMQELAPARSYFQLLELLEK